MKKAILCGLVSPSMNAILLRGPAGTPRPPSQGHGRPRPGRRVVNLPLNSTRTRSRGVDFEAAIRTGRKKALPASCKGRMGTSCTSTVSTFCPKDWYIWSWTLEAGKKHGGEGGGVMEPRMPLPAHGTMDPGGEPFLPSDGQVRHLRDRKRLGQRRGEEGGPAAGLRYEKGPIDFYMEFLADERSCGPG